MSLGLLVVSSHRRECARSLCASVCGFAGRPLARVRLRSLAVSSHRRECPRSLRASVCRFAGRPLAPRGGRVRVRPLAVPSPLTEAA